MQSLLKNLLGPIFYGMGVSEADFDSYLSMSMGYVYAILIALAITLGLIFRTQITTFVNNTFADLNA